MLVLAVDTTTPSGSAALLRDGALRAEAGFESPGAHSARLMRAIDLCLAAEGVEPRGLDGFAVAAGPGSFTGIRIGLSTVKALAFATGKPIAAVSSLRALALKLGGGARLACPVLDAKKGQVYAAAFDRSGGGLVPVVPEGAYAPAAFLARVPRGERVELLGSGAAAFRAAIVAALGADAVFPDRSAFAAFEVGRLGSAELEAGRGVRPEALEPLYYRRSQAEDGP